MSKGTEMLIACRDGYLDDGGTLVEVKAGITRIAPELLRDRPEYGEFFEPDVSVPGTDATRVRWRITPPLGLRLTRSDRR